MYLAYNALFTLGVLFMAPYYAWRYRKTSFLRQSWRERLGYLPETVRASKPGTVWVHAVSVGETLAVAPLVERVAAERPQVELFISHVTPTGREAGERRLPERARRFYLPLDLTGPLRRAMLRVRPALLLIAETELWPNLLREAHKAGARVVIVNARLSDRSLKGYRLFRRFMRRVLENVDLIMAQTAADRDRFIAIGARPERTLTMGNLKFDVQPPATADLTSTLRNALSEAHRAPVVVAASTMPGEEEIVLEVWHAVRAKFPRALLVLAPRHPPRFDQVARLIEARGCKFTRRTALDAARVADQLQSAEILLLDTLGELAGIFELADVVFMGGSMVSTGGHNLLEPAWWGKPVVFGPHMENFRDTSRKFLDEHAAVQVRDARQLKDGLIDLLRDDSRRMALGESARTLMRRESGVTERVLERLLRLLDQGAVEPAGKTQ